jgi:hypothetical protein
MLAFHIISIIQSFHDYLELTPLWTKARSVTGQFSRCVADIPLLYHLEVTLGN